MLIKSSLGKKSPAAPDKQFTECFYIYLQKHHAKKVGSPPEITCPISLPLLMTLNY
jgi:hypothetical protein